MALASLVDDYHLKLDRGQSSLLDLSVSFDITDCSIVIHQLDGVNV